MVMEESVLLVMEESLCSKSWIGSFSPFSNRAMSEFMGDCVLLRKSIKWRKQTWSWITNRITFMKVGLVL
jgi:hypothetical protein